MRGTRSNRLRLPLDLVRLVRPPEGAPPTTAPVAPPLPVGRTVALPGRGETFARVAGDLTAPHPVVLLHGWGASADLTFFRLYDALTDGGSAIVAPDLRSHGRGIRSEEAFTLEAVADDVAALVEALELRAPIVVGYSMGGTTALLLAHRHRAAIGGLVLGATAPTWDIWAGAVRAHWTAGAREAFAWRRRGIPRRHHGAVAELVAADASLAPYEAWLAAEELRGYAPDLADIGRVLDGHDTSALLGQIDVPAASVITRRDDIAPPDAQRLVATRLGATVFEVDGPHDAPVRQPSAYAEALLAAIGSVSERVRG